MNIISPALHSHLSFMLVFSGRQAAETWGKIKAVPFQKASAVERKVIFFHISKT